LGTNDHHTHHKVCLLAKCFDPYLEAT
jgi:hypothetical protein